MNPSGNWSVWSESEVMTAHRIHISSAAPSGGHGRRSHQSGGSPSAGVPLTGFEVPPIRALELVAVHHDENGYVNLVEPLFKDGDLSRQLLQLGDAAGKQIGARPFLGPLAHDVPGRRPPIVGRKGPGAVNGFVAFSTETVCAPPPRTKFAKGIGGVASMG